MIGTATKPTKVFRPLPWQVAPWRDKSSVVLLTGSAGGGKSHIALEKVNGYCLKYPGAFALLARKSRVSMTSGSVLFFEDEVSIKKTESILHGAVHRPSKSRFEYANGSMVAYVGIHGKEDRERLKSIGSKGGVDIAFMEEATEFEEADYNAVLARMRGRASDWRQVILATNPDAPTHWIYTRLIAGQEASVHYSSATDNTHNPDEYLDTLDKLTGVDKLRLAKGQWVQAKGLVYEDVYSEEESISHQADFTEGGGPVYWGVDDGYSAGAKFPSTGIDPITKTYAADAHPRVILMAQMRANGQLVIFDELYRVKTLEDDQIEEALELGYPLPDFVAIDSSAAQLRGRLQGQGISVLKSTHRVEEGIKEVRRWLAPDENGFRRVLIHPRCRHLRYELLSYIYDDKGKPVKAFDHGPDPLRYLIWKLRYE